MAAYAALVSLLNLVEDVKNHPCHSNSFHKTQITSLCENVNFLLDFMECYDYHLHRGSIEDLETQIASAAHAVEDAIESYIVNQIHDKTSGLLDLQKKMEEIDYLKEKVMKIEEEERRFTHKRPKLTMPAAATSSTHHSRHKNTMVGLEDEFLKLVHELTRQQSSRQIISIIGMGGIGKTTLAQNLYEYKAIVRHFDFLAWATISQHYDAQEILLQLLSSKGESSTSTYELGDRLHRKLYGRRYLIVLDDMWSGEVWDKIKFFFPDNANDSRIIITTRLANVTVPFTSSSFVMKFLDEHKSWELFNQTMFEEDGGCPPELEEIGRKIVKKCRGLPLPLVVIGRHLSKCSGLKEYWESIANDINLILDSRDEGEQCLEILSLSYYHLPTHLKPCLLYMGIFREDEVINVPFLINLWLAEGILKPNKFQTMEELGMEYLKDLNDRNLMIVHKWDQYGGIRFVKFHDILREVCIKLAKEEEFFSILDPLQNIYGDGKRRVVVQDQMLNAFHASSLSSHLVRSLQCKRCEVSFSNFKLLRVMNKLQITLNEASLESSFLQQVNLRYIDCIFVRPSKNASSYQSLEIPPSISMLWNLQTLLIGGSYKRIIAPSDIWEMRQLRHIDVARIHLPDPPPNDLVLHNLLRLSTVENFRLREEVCERIPNVKILHLRYSDEVTPPHDYCPHNLDHFQKLESLRCFYLGRSWFDHAKSLSFPNSLRELALANALLRWEDLMPMLGSLPHLSDLALMNSVFGHKWETVEGGFRSLKYLRIYGCHDLVHWISESSHFPVLRCLELGSAGKLNEIPSDMGEIATLECIKLQSCSVSAAISAARMVMEQEELGNEELQLHVHFQKEEETARFREMVEEEGLICSNLRLAPLTGR